MITRLFLLSAILTGMAVPATAQIGFRLAFGDNHRGRSFQISVGKRFDNHPKQLRRQHRHLPRGRGLARRGLAKGRFGKRRFWGRQQSTGYFRVVSERVWVPGPRRRVFVPARYGYRLDWCGRRVRYCIAPAHYEIVQDPGCWQIQRRRVWVYS